MKKIHVLVEGQTEERFIKDTLSPYLANKNIYINPIIVTTKFNPMGQNQKGGLPHFSKVINQILKLLGDSSADLVTTMFDYYGLPDNFPISAKHSNADPFAKAEAIESEIEGKIDNHKFKAYLSLHEFESLLFSDGAAISDTLMLDNNPFESIVTQFNSPEEINDNPSTAPSKRIINVAPNYDKVLYGSRICKRIGLGKIRAMCRHFNDWLSLMEKI